jgi:hypothetical protein
VLECPSVIVETTEGCGEERKASGEWVVVQRDVGNFMDMSKIDDWEGQPPGSVRHC